MSLLPPHEDDEPLKPPQPKFAIEDSLDDNNRNSQHSRTTSATVSIIESPPPSPRNLSFVNTPNNFYSFNQPFYTPDQTPRTTPSALNNGNASGFPFPDVSSGHNSVAASVIDLTRNTSFQDNSYYSSSRPYSIRSREAFAMPRPRPVTVYSTVQPSLRKVERDRHKSTMLSAAAILPKPWLETHNPYSRISYFLTYAFIVVGIAAGAIRCFIGYKDVQMLSGNLCSVMNENFDSEDGIFGDNGLFFREVDMSGFGNGEFEMATASENNSYVKNGNLYITPTLTSDSIGESAILDGYVYNITGCTYNITQGITYTESAPSSSNSAPYAPNQPFDLNAYTKACSAVSNATSGAVINPVQSARLSTRKTASIKYGRVEVRAKIPTGDWLWPAIWMLPVDNTYGPWPISGEIDIMEARGNPPSYPKQGTDYVRGSLNWGPITWLNAVYKTYGWWSLRRGSYDDGFHTYALEWDKDFMRIYVDTRLHKLLDLRFNVGFFKRGDFPSVVQNGSETIILTNPWVNGTNAAPFDQRFYLILDVAVGGTNGWFPDGNEKPWLDGSNTAMREFWQNKNQWLSSWSTSNPEDRSLVIDYIKMWQQC